MPTEALTVAGVLAVAVRAPGFLGDDEGMALYDAARSLTDLLTDGGRLPPLLEIGSYCGKSATYLGAALRELGTVLFAVDHHRGSIEHQVGWEFHDPDQFDHEARQMDTLPTFRQTLRSAGLEGSVIPVVGPSATVGANWGTPLSFVFIDGDHARWPTHRDYLTWAPHIVPGGLLALHDVVDEAALPGFTGAAAPYEVCLRAQQCGAFELASSCASLRVLRRIAPGV